MRWFYTIGIACYTLLLHISSIWHRKARLIVKGRATTVSKVLAWRKADKRSAIWVHCASLGEFEQARPVIDALSSKNYAVVLSFYSPSGYEVVAPGSADLIIYMPADLPAIMGALVEALRPAMYVMVKYDYWYNLLRLLQIQAVPQIVIAGAYKPSSFLFRWYGQSFAKVLRSIGTIFVQTPSDHELLSAHGFTNAMIGGDTRVNRSAMLPKEQYANSQLTEVRNQGRQVILYGSIYRDDMPIIEQLVNHYLDAYHLIVPHKVEDCSYIVDRWPDAARWSGAEVKQITVVDEMGLLKYLYRYADLAYVGGGVHNATHNTLEPAAYGLPIIVADSTDHANFYEIVYFKEAGVLKVVNKSIEAPQLADALLSMDRREREQIYHNFFDQYQADVKDIIQYIRTHARP